MKYIITLLLFISMFTYLQADPRDVKVRLYLYNDEGEEFDNLVFGIDDEATTGYDRDLGEGQFPCFDVMAFNARFRVAEDCSYLDLREVPKFDTISHTYNMTIEWRGSSTVKIKWFNVSKLIDSAHFIDDYGLNRVFGKMYPRKEDSLTIDNSVFERINIKVWYNMFPTPVTEEPADDFNLYPNPAANDIYVDNNSVVSMDIVDNLGLVRIRAESSHIDISSLSPGLYTVVIETLSGSKHIKKFIKY